MSRKVIRIMAMVLAGIIIYVTSSVYLPAEAEAAGKTLITDAVISARIKELENKLNDTYWNVSHNKNSCGKSYQSNHGCPNCSNANVIKQDWFKKLFGFKKLSTDKFPVTYGVGSSGITPSAQSCAGFAAFAEWYIFRTGDSASVTTKKIGEYKSTQDNWTKYARKGDLIRWSGHSFIYISNDKSGIKVIDCNGTRTMANGKTSANNCLVLIHTLKYDTWSAKFVISRETTRANCKHKSGYQTEWSGSKYVATVCKNCGAAFNHKVDKITNSNANATNHKPIIYAKPYADSEQVYCLSAGTTVNVTGKTVNAYGNTWYQVSYSFNGTEYKGFMYEKSLTGFTNAKP